MVKAVLSEDNINNHMEIKLERGKAQAKRTVSHCHKSLGEGDRAWTKGAVARGIEERNKLN